MICPNCGQTIPKGGTCYNCVKIENDANRYGRGSGTVPAYIKYGPRPNAPRTPPAGHTEPEKKSPVRKRRTGWPGVPGERSLTKRKSTPKRRKSSTLARSQSRRKPHLPKRPLRGATLLRQRRGVNEFLVAVYRQPLLISDILKRQGFSSRQITGVKEQVAHYLTLLVAAWCEQWRDNLTSRQIFIIAHFYRFDGSAPKDKEHLAKKLKVPTKRVMSELNGGILKLRRQHKKQMERTILTTATKILPDSSSQNRAGGSKRNRLREAKGQDRKSAGLGTGRIRPETHDQRISRIRKQYPRAYKPWSSAEEGKLRTLFKQRRSINEIANRLQRQPSAIRSRIDKLGM